MIAAVLFAHKTSIYKGIAGLDVWDRERDALNYNGNLPVIAHPPCRAWGRLSHMANPRLGEKDLAHFAVMNVRLYGGVLEHPAYSKLWSAAQLPSPGEIDAYGGFTLPIYQSDFGHRAQKVTWLYIVGISPDQLPKPYIVLGEVTHTIGKCKTKHKPQKKEVNKSEREKTPLLMALWLVKLVQLISEHRQKGAKNAN